jgi:integrase
MSGHVVKRGKKYSIVVEMGNDETGKRKQKWYSGYRTKKDAETDLHRILHELRTGQFIDTTKLTTGQWLDRWLADYCLHLKPYTVRGYEDTVKRVKAEIGDVPLQRLTTLHVQTMIANWQERGTSANRGPLSANTIRKHMVCLSAALNKAVELDLMRRNPAKQASLPRVDKPEPEVLDANEAQRLLHEVKGRNIYVPVFLALTTGMRRGEVIALHWSDVDFENACIRVRHSAVQVKGKVIFKEPKTGRGRVIALPSFAVRELQSHKARQAEQRLLMGNRWKDHDLVCTMDDGSPMKPEWLSGYFFYFTKTHGFTVSFHDLRHTHASILLREGVHAKVVQERLGHSDIGMTLNTYSHLISGMQEEAANRLKVIDPGSNRVAKGGA